MAAAIAWLAACSEPAAPAGDLEATFSALAEDNVYICPMDLDIRSSLPGVCPRCGMALIPGLPDPVDYALDLEVSPQPLKAGEAATLRFTVRDPWQGRPVDRFQVVHEKIYHLFLMSGDLEYFAHVHPTQAPGGVFSLDIALPKPGLYQALSDFYPDGATPQLIVKSFIVPGGPLTPAVLGSDYLEPRQGENLRVQLRTEPAQPLAGQETEMYFTLAPGDGLEPYLGAWGHMLAASDDLIDTVHGHPFIADGSPEMVFHILFPRARTYRVWVQFQRNGVVNTVHFDIPVQELSL